MMKPFRYSDLKGNAWYRRFLVEEYTIRLNNNYDRYTIHDSELMLPGDDYRVQQYYKLIVKFFLNPENIDPLGSLEILLELRRIKGELFSNEELHIPELRALPADLTRFIERMERGEQEFEESWKQMVRESLHPEGQPVLIQEELLNRLRKAEKIFLLTVDRKSWTSDIITWLVPFFKKQELSVSVFADPLYRGVSPAEGEMFFSTLESMGVSVRQYDPKSLFLSEDAISYLRKWREEGGVVIARGLWPYLALNSCLQDFVVILDSREWLGRALLGLNDRKNIRNYSTPLSPLLEEVVFKEEGALAAFQRSPFPIHAFTGAEYNPYTLRDHISGKKPVSIEERLKRQSNKLRHLANKTSCRFLLGFYRFTGDEAVECGADDRDGVLLAGGIAGNSKLHIRPRLMNGLTSPKDLEMVGTGVLTSFSYFYTANLVSIYNNLVPEKQRFNFTDTLIDYLGMFNDEPVYESLPLFSKGFLGSSKNGELFSGYFPLKKALLTDGQASLIFDLTCINPAKEIQEPALYLPSYEKKIVGKGKHCLVMVQDRVVFEGSGPCRIPPVGVVVTTGKASALDQYKLRWQTELEGLPLPRRKIAWLAGGFNILVHASENLYEAPEKARFSLEKEGWYLPQAALGQETQLLPGVRQPRCVIGKTDRKRILFLSISGRTRLSQGASFAESIRYARLLLERGESLSFLVNLDGGASASLILYHEGYKEVLGVPALSPANPAGVPRPQPSFLDIRIKTDQ